MAITLYPPTALHICLTCHRPITFEYVTLPAVRANPDGYGRSQVVMAAYAHPTPAGCAAETAYRTPGRQDIPARRAAQNDKLLQEVNRANH